MADGDSTQKHPSLGMLIVLGLGIGTVLGLAFAKRAENREHLDIEETVVELKQRTQHVLNELSQNVSGLLDQTRLQLEQAVETGKDFASAQTEELSETIGTVVTEE